MGQFESDPGLRKGPASLDSGSSWRDVLSRYTSDMTMNDTRSHRRHAFTLIELLVVVSLIVLLIALLLPALGRARATGRDLSCRSQFRQLGSAMVSSAQDHENRLPGLWSPPWTRPGREGQGSIFGQELLEDTPVQPYAAGEPGMLVPYLGEDAVRKLVRCPAQPFIAFASGEGSNGIFDYSMIQAFPGARLPKLPATAVVTDPADGTTQRVSTPVLVEEDPAFHINNAPCCIDFGHTSINRLGTWHPNASGNYVSGDGSVHQVSFGVGPGPPCSNWSAKAPSGAIVSLGNVLDFGEWNQK